jgi:hypothetical protein
MKYLRELSTISIENAVIYVPIRHLYNCRENSTNPPLFEKTNPIFPIFRPKTEISKKTNPIQSQFNPKQTQF